MGFFNSLMSSKQVKNAISIAESFLDNFDTEAGYQVKRRVVDNLKHLDGTEILINLESEHLALTVILKTAGDMYAYVPYDPFETSPPYAGLMRLIEVVSERMQKLGYMTKTRSEETISRIESDLDKHVLAKTTWMINEVGLNSPKK